MRGPAEDRRLNGQISPPDPARPRLAKEHCLASNSLDIAHRDISTFPRWASSKMKLNREEWMELCEQAAEEQDSAKLMQLIVRINQLLEAKERRLKGNPPVIDPPD